MRRAGECEVSLVPTSGVAQQQYGGAPAASTRTLSGAVAAIEAAATGAAEAGGAAGSVDRDQVEPLRIALMMFRRSSSAMGQPSASL